MMSAQTTSAGGIVGARKVGLFNTVRANISNRLGKTPKAVSMSEVRRRLERNGGFYRHPDGYLVILWDKNRSQLVIKPDLSSSEESRVRLSLMSGNTFFSLIEPVPWTKAKRELCQQDIPEQMYDIAVFLAEKHGYAYDTPSS